MTEEKVTEQPIILPELKINQESDGKPEIRTKVWDYLSDNKLSLFPWPPHKRISNFKGAEEAGDKAITLDIFEKAEVFKVDPDKPLQQIRIHALEKNKTVLIPTPRLRYGFLNKITPPDTERKTLKTCATRVGFSEYSTPVGIDDNIHVDIVVVGSVAVSSKGWRVGKGEGYSDLEYAIMASMGSVDDKVPVVAIVHDCQIMDLPDRIFGPHDVGVDYIVTPTRVIKCENKPSRPKGIIWSLLSAEKLEAIPVLRKLRYRDWKAGKDVKISGESEQPAELVDEELKTEDTEERRVKPRSYRGNYRRRQRKSREVDGSGAGDGEGRREKEDDEEGGRVNGSPRRSGFRGGYRGGWSRRGRGGRRGGSRSGGGSRRRESENDGGDGYDDRDDKENRGGRGGGGFRPRRYRVGRRQVDDFEGSVYVGSLPRSLRVSDFKGEVRDRKVNPLRVMWRGSSGFAFLNFKTKQEAEEALVALEGLHFDDRDLRLEMAKDREPRSGGGGGGRRRRQRDSRSEEDEEDGEGRDN